MCIYDRYANISLLMSLRLFPRWLYNLLCLYIASKHHYWGLSCIYFSDYNCVKRKITRLTLILNISIQLYLFKSKFKTVTLSVGLVFVQGNRFKLVR